MNIKTLCIISGVCLSQIFLVHLAFPRTIFAHSGRTDAYGCHNCYTSYCYGQYHCHGGGSYVAPAPSYNLPLPVNPTNGNWTYQISSDNWCNYDLTFTWNKPISGDRFSIAVSKNAGANPGPLVDTTSYDYTFNNLTPGRWYINLKTGNSERWGGISYWTIDLPKPIPNLNALIIQKGDNQYLNYDIACMERVEGPSEWINFLNSTNNKPKGEVMLTYSALTTLSLKGWDKTKKEYSQTLTFSPLTKITTIDTTSSKTNTNEDNILLIAIGCLCVCFVLGWLSTNIET